MTIQPVLPLTIDWGDGFLDPDVQHTSVTHVFPDVSREPGEYTVTVFDQMGRKGVTTIFVARTPVIKSHSPASLDSGTSASFVTVTLYGEHFVENIEYSYDPLLNEWLAPAVLRDVAGRIDSTRIEFNLPRTVFEGETQVELRLRVMDATVPRNIKVSDPYIIPVDANPAAPFSSAFGQGFQPSQSLPGVAGPTVPPNMTVTQTLSWVGSDKVRAQAALTYEQSQNSPRVTLITALNSVLAAP